MLRLSETALQGAVAALVLALVVQLVRSMSCCAAAKPHLWPQPAALELTQMVISAELTQAAMLAIIQLVRAASSLGSLQHVTWMLQQTRVPRARLAASLGWVGWQPTAQATVHTRRVRPVKLPRRIQTW